MSEGMVKAASTKASDCVIGLEKSCSRLLVLIRGLAESRTRGGGSNVREEGPRLHLILLH